MIPFLNHNLHYLIQSLEGVIVLIVDQSTIGHSNQLALDKTQLFSFLSDFVPGF